MFSKQLPRILAFAGTIAVTPCAPLPAAAQDSVGPAKFYQMVGGKVDARTYNGFRRYNAVVFTATGRTE